MFGIMAVLLGSGDAFHLVPRAVALCTTGLENFTVQMGLEKWITSITMTILKSSPPQNLQQVVANSDCRQTWCWVLCPAPFFANNQFLFYFS